jgi:hypothetical protein
LPGNKKDEQSCLFCGRKFSLIIFAVFGLLYCTPFQLRGASPPHKKKQFDSLVKQLNGDEDQIRMKIQEWWDEPGQPGAEEVWEDVNKAKAKPKPNQSGKFRGGRSGSQADGGGERGGGRGRGGREG